MNRLMKPQTKKTVVDLQTMQILTFDQPSIPNWTSDGYSQTALPHGWHVMFRDPEDTELLDHVYMVNQYTGQQFQVKMMEVTQVYKSFIRYNEELDQTNGGGFFYEPTVDSAITIKWRSLDNVGVIPENIDRHYVLYCCPEGDVFIRVQDLINPLMDADWFKEKLDIEAPSLTWRSARFHEYAGLRVDMSGQ